MPHRMNFRAVLSAALALAAFAAFTPAAGASFTVTINGVLVATDQGAGDQDADTGVIQFIDTVGSHQIRLTAVVDQSLPGGNVTISELQVVASGGPGDTTGPLQIAVSSTGSGAGGTGLSSSLTRNRVGGLGTSGTAGAFAAATGVGATAPVLLSRAVDAGETQAVVRAPGGEFELTQTVFVTDLRGGDGLTLTAAADVFGVDNDGPTKVSVIDPAPDRMADVLNNPAPAGLVLLGAGLPVVGLFRRRLLSK